MYFGALGAGNSKGPPKFQSWYLHGPPCFRLGYFDGQLYSEGLICGFARLQPATIWAQALWPSLGKSKSAVFCHKQSKEKEEVGGVMLSTCFKIFLSGFPESILLSKFQDMSVRTKKSSHAAGHIQHWGHWIVAQAESASFLLIRFLLFWLMPSLTCSHSHLMIMIIVNLIFTIMFVYSWWTVGEWWTNCISITVTPPLPPTHSPFHPSIKMFIKSKNNSYSNNSPTIPLPRWYSIHLKLLKVPVNVNEGNCRGP